MKKTLAQVGAIIAIGAAGVLTVTKLAVPGRPHYGARIGWQYAATNELAEMGFEIVMRTNLKAPWQVVGNAIGTNLWFVPSNRPAQAFYTISRVYRLDNTNVGVNWRGN